MNLIPGSYTIAAKHAGFSRRVYRGFVVQVGQTARRDIVLEVGAVEQTVEVTVAIPLLHTEDATIGQASQPSAPGRLRLHESRSRAEGY